MGSESVLRFTFDARQLAQVLSWTARERMGRSGIVHDKVLCYWAHNTVDEWASASLGIVMDVE